MPHRCLVMFSGGLDSAVAAHLLRAQGLEVEALHFVLPFDAGLGLEFSSVRAAASRIGIPLHIVEEGTEFLDMMRNPQFGYGKNINPCVDCRIHRLVKAKRIMEERGADFLATGEVLGQRPMSQTMDKLYLVAKRAGLTGLLLRPLSAKLLRPTMPEERGWVDRERLLDIRGRGRAVQRAYAQEHGLVHQSPAGGCLLTNEGTLRRYRDLFSHNPNFDLEDFRLLARGRHLRLSAQVYCVVSRTGEENELLERIVSAGDVRIEILDTPGPLAIVRGAASEEQIAFAAGACARYSRVRTQPQVRVRISKSGEERELTVSPASEEECARLLV